MSALLRLLWLASPALPVGGFSYSEGLEAAVEAGDVHDEASTLRWLTHQLELGIARSEAPVLVQALRAWKAHDVSRLKALNDWVLATRESAELRLQTEQMGRSLADWWCQRQPNELALATTLRALRGGPTWPLSFALAASSSQATESEAVEAFAFSWCEAMVQAAVKAVPLGQNAGQRVLQGLMERLPGLPAQALACGDAQRQCFSPRLAILSARHESQYSRLFRS
jgi:urease accessory protein